MGGPVSPFRKLMGLIAFTGTLLLFVLRLRDHGELKSALIRSTLGGLPRERIDAWTATFVPGLLERGVFTDALERIEQHRQRGARLVLMSASTDLYVPAIANVLKFDEVICTGVVWNGDRLDGRLSTPNRRGAEKTRCLRELRAAHAGVSTAAYGNAGSDLDHLRLADQPLLVNGSAAARRAATRLGIPTARWR